MDMGQHKVREDIGWFFGLFVISFFMYCFMRMGGDLPINADEISCYFLAEDMFQGNLWLEDWHLSTGIFLLPSIEVYVLSKCFGYQNAVFYIAGALNYALMMTTCVYIVYRKVRISNLKFWWIYPILTLLFVLVPRMNEYMYNSCTHTLSIAAGIWSFLGFQYINNRLDTFTKKYCLLAALLILLAGWLSATNTMYAYACLIPMICVGFYSANSNFKNGAFFVICGGLALGISEAIKKCYIYFRNGESLGSIKTVFLEQNQILKSIQATMVSVLKLFWIDFWGQNVYSTKTLISLLGALVMVILLREIWQYIRLDKHDDYAILFFLFMGMVNIFANGFAKSILSHDVHLMQPALLGFPTAGMLCWIDNMKAYGEKNRNRQFGFAAIVGILFILVCPKLSYHPAVNRYDVVARYLLEHGHTEGIATFWICSSVMYRGKWYDGNLDIYPVCFNEKGLLTDYKWMSKGEIGGKKFDYCIVSNKEGIEENILKAVGPYSEKKEFDYGLVLYLWDEKQYITCVNKKDILKNYMRFSNEKMLLNDGSVIIKDNEALFGPYQSFQAGMYRLRIHCVGTDKHSLLITSGSGKTQLYQFSLHEGWNKIVFDLDSEAKQMEFVIRGNSNSDLHVSDMQVEDVY